MNTSSQALSTSTPDFLINPERLLDDLRALAHFGKVSSGVNRRALSPVDLEAREWLASRMRDAGLTTEIDGVGNVIGRTPHERRIVIGSHTDTVPNGGWLDGAMGVIYGLEIARAFMEAGGGGRIGLEIVSFSDEEGCYVSLLGSHSYCGELDHQEALAQKNDEGMPLSDALSQAGLVGRAEARLNPSVHLAYLEAHIEQGPVLEARGIPIGVVTAIVGIRRWRVIFIGQADHAGTTPMSMRRDAGAAVCDFAVRIAEFCYREGGEHTVWNGGSIHLTPGAHSVVPSRADYVFTTRDADTRVLDNIKSAVEKLSAEVAKAHRVNVEMIEIFSMTPTPMDPRIMDLIGAAADVWGLRTAAIPSGALHDAMMLGRHVPAGMLFIPSIGGRSHDIVEDSDPRDIVNGAKVLASAFSALARALQN